MLDDISGNSFVENPFAPKNDQAMTVTKYDRTEEQDNKLGIHKSSQQVDELPENEGKLMSTVYRV